MPRWTIKTVSAMAFAMVIWASSFPGIRAGLAGYSPTNLYILRFLIASLMLALYAWIAHFRRLELRDFPGVIFASAIGISFANWAMNYGETTVTAGAASMLIMSTPVWTAIAARIWLHEELSVLGWLGVIISFAGVTLIASGESGGVHFSPQALTILAAAICCAGYIVLQKQYLQRYSPLEFTAYSIWFGTALMLPLTYGSNFFVQLKSAPIAATLAVAYIGVFPGALAYVAWAYVLSHGPASKTTSMTYVIPVLAIVISWIWLGELPSLLACVGGVIALVGVVMVNMKSKPQTPPEPSSNLA